MDKKRGASKTAVFITRLGMGSAPEELSMLLLKNYLNLLKSENLVPAYICLYAQGVKCACEGSSVIDELRALEAAGARIISCKTCLGYYNLSSKLLAGIEGTMLDIIEVQNMYDKHINL